MRTETVRFYSRGSALAGTLTLPDAAADGPVPAVGQGPGWLGLRDAKLYQPYHEAFLAAGMAVFVFDYRGFGDSEGDATYLDPATQVEDWHNAVTYLTTRPEIDPERIGAFGSGGTGGGNAIAVAGRDERIKAVVSQVPVADGRDWLHRMRRESEWLDFLARLEADARRRASEGVAECVDPRDGIMVPTPERRTTSVKSDVDGRVPRQVELASAEAIFAYRPIDVVDRIAPRALMIICVEGDATTPEDHAQALYERAGGPKRLVVQTGTTHYAAYAQYRDVVNPLIVAWFGEHLVGGEVLVHEQPAEARIVRLSRPEGA
ncbi:MAG TPA: alpha/beta fold hydrolase [Candidatus Limnocylindrales bacterium]|nr:alpha/beta fold hydrolase [Candidatus Limnocylindrales bacterium]